MKRFILLILVGLSLSLAAPSQTPALQLLNRDPEKAKFITSDIDNFWRAFDLAARESDREKKIAIFQTEYLDKGSVGLKDFLRLRIKSAKDLTELVEATPRFFSSIRPSTLRVSEMEKEMRRSFRRFKKIYPDALFPDVYFLIGVANTGGTASSNGLLIGTELFGLTSEMPRDEFPAYFKRYLRDETDENQLRLKVNRLLDIALKPIENVPPTVAHELIHFNQKYPKIKNLLEQSIVEGSADFLGEMIGGELMNPHRNKWGDKHEADLWREFQNEMNGTNYKNWLYNGLTSLDRPSDLGYYMGYKISQHHYKNAGDKRQAIKDILIIGDFEKFLETTRYAAKFGKKP